MPNKLSKPKKTKAAAKLSQKQKFIAAARQAEADESGETFEKAVRAIVPPKRPVSKLYGPRRDALSRLSKNSS